MLDKRSYSYCVRKDRRAPAVDRERWASEAEQSDKRLLADECFTSDRATSLAGPSNKATSVAGTKNSRDLNGQESSGCAGKKKSKYVFTESVSVLIRLMVEAD